MKPVLSSDFGRSRVERMFCFQLNCCGYVMEWEVELVTDLRCCFQRFSSRLLKPFLVMMKINRGSYTKPSFCVPSAGEMFMTIEQTIRKQTSFSFFYPLRKICAIINGVALCNFTLETLNQCFPQLILTSPELDHDFI